MKLKGYEHMKFYTCKEFHKKYPEGAGGYTVIGMLGSGVGKGQASETILVGNEIVEYYPYKAPGVFYEIKGYLRAGDNEYVYIAVQQSRAWKLFLLLVLMLAVIAGALYGFSKTPAGVQLDPSSGKYKANVDLPDTQGQTYINLPGYSDIYVSAGDNIGNAALWNPETNGCYFKYAIRLKATDEVIYESGLIAPGDAVTEQKYDRTFEQGTYPVIISITTFDINDYERQLNGGEIETNLIAVVEGK